MSSTNAPLESIWPEATDRLRADPAFGPVVEKVGPIQLRPRRGDPFQSIAAAIIHQQLAGAAARTIHQRFLDRFESRPVTPDAVLELPEPELRAAGLSAAKASAIRSLAEHATRGDLGLDRLDRLDDAEVAERLTAVRGIGPWTVQMFLMFDLRRPDVWPVGDLGVRKGLGLVLGLVDPPSPQETELIGTGYRPWRSAVAWYCWRAIDTA